MATHSCCTRRRLCGTRRPLCGTRRRLCVDHAPRHDTGDSRRGTASHFVGTTCTGREPDNLAMSTRVVARGATVDCCGKAVHREGATVRLPGTPRISSGTHQLIAGTASTTSDAGAPVAGAARHTASMAMPAMGTATSRRGTPFDSSDATHFVRGPGVLADGVSFLFADTQRVPPGARIAQSGRGCQQLGRRDVVCRTNGELEGRRAVAVRNRLTAQGTSRSNFSSRPLYL